MMPRIGLLSEHEVIAGLRSSDTSLGSGSSVLEALQIGESVPELRLGVEAPTSITALSTGRIRDR